MNRKDAARDTVRILEHFVDGILTCREISETTLINVAKVHALSAALLDAQLVAIESMKLNRRSNKPAVVYKWRAKC